MNAVLLHPLWLQINLLHKKGQQRQRKLFRQPGIDIAEGFRVATAIVRRQADLHQQRLRARGLYLADDLPQVLLQLLRRKTAQAVVSSQFNQHPTWLMLLQQGRQASQSLRRRIAAYATVNDSGGFLPFIIE